MGYQSKLLCSHQLTWTGIKPQEYILHVKLRVVGAVGGGFGIGRRVQACEASISKLVGRIDTVAIEWVVHLPWKTVSTVVLSGAWRNRTSIPWLTSQLLLNVIQYFVAPFSVSL